ncbi:helix-turn-helix transcriptional regulator [Candidatus Palauibacter sp.]|uniref:helix-turn-helix transcriptional regulator n=1 Tax=Candidatus Palauibacter sp. TaxID=3101350 RepID=UPI003B51DA42
MTAARFGATLPRRGTFSMPIDTGTRAVGWVEAEVDGWIRERIAESRFQGSEPGECDEGRARDPRGSSAGRPKPTRFV